MMMILSVDIDRYLPPAPELRQTSCTWRLLGQAEFRTSECSAAVDRQEPDTVPLHRCSAGSVNNVKGNIKSSMLF